MEDGELITFGQGASGRLGTGKMANRYETCIKASFCAPIAIPTTCPHMWSVFPTGHSKNHKLPVSLGSHGFATKLKHSETGEKTATQKRHWGC